MKIKRVGHGRMRLAVCSALLSATTLAAAGPREVSADGLAHLSNLSVPQEIQSGSLDSPALHRSLADAIGRQHVLVRLKLPSVALGRGQVTREQVLAEQADFISQAVARAPSTNVISSVQLVLNAVMLDVDAADLPEIARDLRVTRIVGVRDYERELVSTVPYIGASTAHSLGATGAGVRVAVLDSGVDYTHAAFGGPGTQAAYEAAWAPIPIPPAAAIPVVPAGTGYLVTDDPGTTADDGLFPSAKVVGGFDFVGETWPTPAVLNPDPDPIGAPDATTNGGHGTHVAHIIGGVNGVAPGVQLYAFKVCSAPATSCSGVALIQGMEWSVDPNRDGNPADHVDIINMSLGSPYGQPFDDDLSAAVDAATALGVLTVASAGNSADKQFITGSPAAATTALSVAQTEVPTATLGVMDILVPATPPTRFAVFQPWSAPQAGAIEGAVLYFPGSNPGKSVGCADAAGTSPYAPGELAGRIVLVDRGLCSFSLKIANIGAAGGILGIIGLIDGSAPFAGAFGGGAQPIPGYMISLADANAIRGGATIRMSSMPLSGALTSTSSRGPRFDDSIVKPEIGAPGASVSARSGGFTATSPFGGTSGAAPMVSGSAAILKGARPELAPLDIKQILVNTAETNIIQPSVLGSVFPDQAAPISRIGGGEVRVDRALLSPSLVTDVTGDDVSAAHGAVSFGFVEADLGRYTYNRVLRVRNTSNRAVSYSATTTFRYQDDVNSGAVSLSVRPARFTVPANGWTDVDATLTLRSALLPNNLMNAGNLGNAIGPLTANEYDGYLVFQASNHRLTMPWHILPRKASNVEVLGKTDLVFDSTNQKSVRLKNFGVGAAQLQSFSLLGTSPDAPEGGRGEQLPNPDLRAVGISSLAVPAGSTLCGSASATAVLEFAFNAWERDATPVGTFFEVDFDIDRNGIPDFVLWNRDLSGNTTLTDGRQVSALLRLNATGTTIVATTIRFFAENATNTGNTVLRICASDLGLTTADLGVRLIDTYYFASSWYFGGPVDELSPTAIVLAAGAEQYRATVPASLASLATAAVPVTRLPLPAGATPHGGLMLVTNSGFSANPNGATQASEIVLLPAAP